AQAGRQPRQEEWMGAASEVQPACVCVSGGDGGRMVNRSCAGSVVTYDLAIPRGTDSGHCGRICRTDPGGAFRRTQMNAGDLLTVDPKAEAFYSGALGRISRLMVALAVALSIAGWWRYGWRVALGFAGGCAVAYLNFHWLKKVVIALADRSTQPGKSQSSSGMVLRFLL